MRKINSISFVFILLTSTACISTLNTNKSKTETVYSENLTAYLPKDVEDTVTIIVSENENFKIDSTLIITARLDTALLRVNKYNANRTRYIEGLTIQLYSGNDRSNAINVKMRAYRYFPDSKPKVIFDQPNYKVRMNEFYSQLEAYPVFKEAQSKFGKAILVPIRIPVSAK